MEEARAVLARLERIDALEREDVPASVLLDEVRALLTEAEAWARVEPAATDLAADAIERCRSAFAEGDGQGSGGSRPKAESMS